ncbi:hypothetical protein WISP_75131 [Willisornis vidua]|uniref:Reverse transcriptase domain-containing protein n=1 Tax=Willisornis vidua TaxID=1566151 RepID=A0ABQ9D6B6_9PASS|nr:hypothetical protein WISP_75131 [Willisornis vidua]
MLLLCHSPSPLKNHGEEKRCLMAGGRPMLLPFSKRGRMRTQETDWPVSLTSILGRVMEQVILKVITKYIEENQVIRNSQHGFTKGKSYLTNLIDFYDGLSGWVNGQSALDVSTLSSARLLTLSPMTSS